MSVSKLTYKKILIFWLPLAATWLMMSVEGPFLAAIIARLQDAKFNLAAYGVAFSLALIIEAPIIMMMSASTALVQERQSYFKLRNFNFWLSALITLAMLALIIPDIFHFLTIKLIGLPENVAHLTHISTIILLPWPGAIGYRRFYQGILIRNNLTRRVAYGTILRLISMSSFALLFYFLKITEGAYVGAGALSFGVISEALAIRLMAHQVLNKLINGSKEPDKKLTYHSITSFYYPLALTSILGLGINPFITFFMGHSRFALESLAVLPVVNSLVFIFRSVGLSYQEVAIALMGEDWREYKALRNFALILGISASSLLATIVFTPLAAMWFMDISGLSAELARFAILPAQILVLIPALSVLLSFQRAMLVNSKHTSPISIATLLEVSAIIVMLYFLIYSFDLIGATAAAAALITGRLCANLFLLKNTPGQHFVKKIIQRF